MDKLTKLREKIAELKMTCDEVHLPILNTIMLLTYEDTIEEEPSEEIVEVPDFDYRIDTTGPTLPDQVEILTKGLQQLQRQMALLKKS